MKQVKRDDEKRCYAFITGASSGIGLATARLFVEKGWCVGLGARDPQKLEESVRLLGDKWATAYQMDVTDPASVEAALKAFGEHSGGRLDALVNSAGVLVAGHFEEVPLAKHHAVLDTNLKGLVNTLHVAFPLLKNNAEGAVVVNISSASALYGAPDFASYSASKFAVRALTEALNLEWARFNIKVSDVMPPFVDTPMLDPSVRTNLKAISWLGVNLTPEDVAASVWENVRSARVHTVVGLPFKVVALGQKYSPSWLQKRFVKFVSGY